VINHVTTEAGQDYYGYGYGYQYDGGEAAVESTGPLQQAA
jgi:hypothetical protein